ncbi:hypothetical protein [Maridesulfovibrio hydrothermalis]|uniref:Uncharacterized protein n=1 Tax=Maridesulfovibrio hydrothermalis AM13 = DSM 14728 TaxID=1121451 RepID=L0RAR2_9BACT|nr:hypothetical protein [Maridesulfovibrio hydrothermalis]CCO22661.1 conserved exported protein of unknown function [Maridesulfovibrio hydrothermalis AM13 = DSM 14728]
MNGRRGKSSLKLAVLLAAMLLVVCAGYYKLEDLSAARVREFTDRYSHLARIDFERALINPFDRSLSVWGVRFDFATGSSCFAEKIVIDKFDSEHRIPRFFKGAVEGVSVPVDFMNFGTLAGDFRKMGYEKLNFDLSADYIYEDDTRRLSVKTLRFDGADLCRINAGFDLGDVKLRNPGIGGLVGVSMLDGRIVWDDKSLTRKVFGLSAAEENTDVAAYIGRLSEALQLKMQEARSLGNGYAENFYAEMKKFIENPERLVIQVEPMEPVPLLYMFMGRNFEELLDLYGVTVEAENL